MLAEIKNPKSIVLVDDNENDRHLLKASLLCIANEITIIELENGLDLMRMMNEKEPKDYPALIVMDMTGMKSLETLVYLKSVKDYSHIPIVILSANINQPSIYQLYLYGASAFIAKPLLFEEYVRIAGLLNNLFLNHSLRHQGTEKSRNEKGNVLIIENNPDHWLRISQALRQTVSGIDIFRTFDRPATLNFLLLHWKTLPNPPRLILLDLYLPSRDVGLSLLDTIRSFFISHDKAPVPIIIFSRSDHDEDIAASYRHFANAYVTKPTEPDDWFPCITHIYNFWFNTAVLPEKSKTTLP